MSVSNELTDPHWVAREVGGVALTMTAFALGALCLLTPRPTQATTARWIELGPPPAVRLPMVYDTNRSRALIIDRTVIWAASNDPIPKWSKIWEGVTPIDPPRVQSNQVWVYDPLRDRIWGIDLKVTGTSMSFPGRVWTMDLGTMPLSWVERSFANPAPELYNFAVALDAPRDRILLFGGNSGCPECVSNEVQILNLAGTPTWSLATIVGTPPTPRTDAVAVYDPIRDRMLFYGGTFQGPPIAPSFTVFDETWALSLTTDPMSWSFLTPTTAVAYARWRPVATYDADGQRMIVTGGVTTSGGRGIINDTWALDLSQSTPPDQALWTALAAGPSDVQPPGRTMSIGWIDADRSRLLRYGSGQATFTATIDPRFDLWSLSLSGTPAWSAVHADSVRPPMHIGHVAFPDASGLSWVMGLGDPGGLLERPSAIDASVPWHPIGSGGPGVRFWPGAAVDVAGSRVLVFGGGSSSNPMTLGTEYADLWSYDFTTGWSELSTIGAPTVRAEALTLFDASRRRLIVHGGRYSAINKVRERSDTWMYDAASNIWSELAAGTFGGRWAEVGIYDPVRDRLIAVGGRDTLQTFSDLHVLPLGVGGTWAPLAASGPTPPLGNAQSVRVAYDAPRDRMLVVGYRSDQMRVFALSLDANPTWTEVAVDGVRPDIRQDYAAAVDLAGGRMLISGGRQIFSSNFTDDDWVLVFDQATPVTVSLASTDATAERVRIRWQVGGAPNALFAAYRRTPGGGWSDIASLQPNGSGFVTLEDRDVRPGDRFDYRLGVSEGGSERYFGEVSVVVPMTNAVRLDGARPNPVSGAMWVSFALATDAPATLEVVDVMGRRILERAVGPLGPGEHTLRVSEPGRLPAGLYLVRLIQGPERRITKFVVAR